MRRRNLRGGNRRFAPNRRPFAAQLEPGGIRETRAPLLGLNRLRPPFWPPSEIPRSVVDPFTTVLMLSAGRPVFTADYYAVDGVSGKVASFVDWNNSANLFSQATAGNQAAIPTTDATANNAYVVSATGNEAYSSNQPASFWRFCHETSTEFFATVKINQAFWNRIFGSQNQTAALRGWLICNKDSSTSAWAQYVGNATGTYHGQALSADSSAGVGTWRQVSSRYVPSTSVVVRTASTDVTGSISGAAPSGDPATTMNMFFVGGVVSRVSIAAMWGWFPALTAPQRLTVQAYLQAKTGVSA